MKGDFMHLKLATYSIKDVVWGSGNLLSNGILKIDKRGIERSLSQDGRFKKVHTDIAFSFDQTGFWRVRAWDY